MPASELSIALSRTVYTSFTGSLAIPLLYIALLLMTAGGGQQGLPTQVKKWILNLYIN
jgi:hypothetical protein